VKGDQVPHRRLKNILSQPEGHHLGVFQPFALVHVAQERGQVVSRQMGTLGQRPPQHPAVRMPLDVNDEPGVHPALLELGKDGGWLGKAPHLDQVVVGALQDKQPVGQQGVKGVWWQPLAQLGPGQQVSASAFSDAAFAGHELIFGVRRAALVQRNER